jgi:hypothetical protein
MKYLRIANHRSSDRRVLDDIVLLDYSQNIAAELAHLPIVFLDHPNAARYV